jgi:hypothetical protein
MAHQVWIGHLICTIYALTLCVAKKRENAPNPGRFSMRDQAKNQMACQSALNVDPLSASKIDPPLRGGLCR